MNDKIIRLGVFTFGLIVTSIGIIEVLLSLTGETLIVDDLIKFAGNFMLWRGLVLGSAGIFLVFGLNIQNPVEVKAQVLLASIMIWIVGGMEVLDIILGSIPGEGMEWISTGEQFIGHYGGPYDPGIFLLPLSLALVWVTSRKMSNQGGETVNE
ncbi:MAG: hypothetical protein ACLFVS_03550 [Candidatus Acetothermia bacterium]